jgi:hypothetical protein
MEGNTFLNVSRQVRRVLKEVAREYPGGKTCAPFNSMGEHPFAEAPETLGRLRY